jgi:hypothetical protein
MRGGRSRRQDGPRLSRTRSKGTRGYASCSMRQRRRHLRAFSSDEPELGLRRTPRGIEVRGPGEVVSLPLSEPSGHHRFRGWCRRASSRTVQNPSCALPARRSSLCPGSAVRRRAPGLFPELAWRGGDGLLIGDGVHIPWKDGPDYDELDRRRRPMSREGWSCSLARRRARPSACDGTTFDRISSRSTRMGRIRRQHRAVGWDIDAVRGRARAPPP